MVKISINGFGRIGRAAFKIAFDRRDVEIVAVNDPADLPVLAHLLQYDSTYGIYERHVEFDQTNLIVDGRKIPFYHETDPAALPWKKLTVDVVIESSGHFNDPQKATAHLKAGARKVVLSAPAKGSGAKTVVLGVNEEVVTSSDRILSNASCTTNCVAPIMKLLTDRFGVRKAFMTTIHAATSSERLLDAPARDLRLSRSALESIIPATTGASRATALTIPELTDKFNGLAIRVPTPTVSMIDLSVILKHPTTIDELKQLFRTAAAEPYYQGILDVTEHELVSVDFCGNAHSAIVDLPLTDVLDGDFVKIIAWYDNEWGYSNRLVELATDFGKAD